MSEIDILAEMMEFAENEKIVNFQEFVRMTKRKRRWQPVLANEIYRSAMRSFIDYLARKTLELENLKNECNT